MNRLNSITNNVRQDLRRLWPVVSTTLYPETERGINETIKDLHESSKALADDEEGRALLAAVDTLQQVISAHYKQVAQLITLRLTAMPYGAAKFPADFFVEACDKHELSSANIKTCWNHVRALARTRLAKVRCTPEEKLAYARLNSAEQDILYVLYFEHQYLCPLILNRTE